MYQLRLRLLSLIFAFISIDQGRSGARNYLNFDSLSEDNYLIIDSFSQS